MLLWYVWIGLVDGAWHRLDDIAGQLHLHRNAVSWAAKFLSDHGLAELGKQEIRFQQTQFRFEDIVKTLPHEAKIPQTY